MENEEFYISLGKNMRSMREAKKMTQEEVGNRLGVSKMTISSWESGKKRMYAKSLKEYCEIIGVKMEDVLN
jgi:transcriptional regulator with XRE-family HTH domain